MAAYGGDGSSPMGGLGPMAAVVLVFIGLVVVAAIQQFAPTIGGSIEKATKTMNFNKTGCTDSIGSKGINCTSKWDATYNTNLPQSADMYTNNAQMGNLLVLIIIVSLILAYLIRI